MKITAITAAAAVAVAASPAVAQTVTHNANPSIPFTYGSGNDYSPANASVLTNGNAELAARFHITGQQANQSVSGLYAFALGTTNISFDYSAFGGTGPTTITLRNQRTGDVAGFNSTFFPDGNGANAGYQGSQRLSFGFLNGSTAANAALFGDLNFDANVDNTYRFTLSDGTNTLTTFAQVGAGFGAVPEPSTWAMLILGFGLVGGTMRRSTTKTRIAFA